MIWKLMLTTLAALAASTSIAAAETDGMTTPTAANESTLVIIGASYAQDWGMPPLPGFEVVVNRGIGGQDSSEVRSRFASDAVAQRPDAVLIWGHINDIHRAPAGQMAKVKERVKQNYQEMVAQAQAAGIKVILGTEVTLTIADTWKEQLAALLGRLRGKEDYRSRVNREVQELNEWLRSYAKQNQLQLLDLERATRSDNGTRKPEYTSADGSHISKAGYAALTSYVTGELR